MPKKDIIDNMNDFLKAVHDAKKCPDPKCKGALVQHKRKPRALFCSSCFKLYELRDATFDRWHRLVVVRKKPATEKGPKPKA